MTGPDIAIGALGLAGLFNNAVEWFEYVHVARDHERRLRTRLLQLDNAQLRLTRWGDAFGLSETQIESHDSDGYSFTLNADEKHQAEEIFRQLLEKFQTCRDICHSHRGGKGEDDPSVKENEITPFGPDCDPMRRYLHQRMQKISHSRKNRVSTFRKAKFAIYQDKHLIELIKDINGFLDDLYQLFPPPEDKQAQLSKEELDQLVEVLRELESVAKACDPTLASAVQHVLTQKNNMRIDNRNNVIQWQGIKSGGSDTQNVHKPMGV